MRPDVIRHSAEGWIGEPEIPDFYLFIRTEGLPDRSLGRTHPAGLKSCRSLFETFCTTLLFLVFCLEKRCFNS